MGLRRRASTARGVGQAATWRAVAARRWWWDAATGPMPSSWRAGISNHGFRLRADRDCCSAADLSGREVHYVVADVLDLPREWRRSFDLVVESLTVQSMPPEQHTAAAQSIAALVAPEGTLLVLATTRDERSEVKMPLAADACRARGLCESRPCPLPG